MIQTVIRLLILLTLLPAIRMHAQSSAEIMRDVVRWGSCPDENVRRHAIPSPGNTLSDTIFSFAAPGTFPVGLVSDGSNFWISDVDSNQIYKVSPTGQLLRTLDVSEQVGFLLWDPPRLIGVNEQEGRVVGVDTADGSVQFLFPTPDSAALDPNSSGIAWDGENYWLSVYSTPGLIYKLDGTTGAVVDSIQPPAIAILGIIFVDGYLYGVDIPNQIMFKMDTSTGASIENEHWEVPYPLGLHWDGSTFWSVSGRATLGKARIYQVASSITAVDEGGAAAGPQSYQIFQNYPNPFNPVTTLEYTLPVRSMVQLRVFDVIGRQVALLVDELEGAGTHVVQWDASPYPSGVYYCTLSAGAFAQTRKLLLIR